MALNSIRNYQRSRETEQEFVRRVNLRCPAHFARQTTNDEDCKHYCDAVAYKKDVPCTSRNIFDTSLFAFTADIKTVTHANARSGNYVINKTDIDYWTAHPVENTTHYYAFYDRLSDKFKIVESHIVNAICARLNAKQSKYPNGSPYYLVSLDECLRLRGKCTLI